MESTNTHFQCVFKVERLERLERVIFKSNHREVIFLIEEKTKSLRGGQKHPLQALQPLWALSLNTSKHIDLKSMKDG